MKNRKVVLHRVLCSTLVALLAVGTVSCGINEKDIASGETKKKLSQIEKLIEENYLNEKDDKKLQEGLYKGLVNGLEDPYSVYYDEKETKELLENTEGKFDGIGVLLSQDRDSGAITMVQVYDDSPAEKAGLKDNDILYKVDGKEVTGEELTEVVTRIKGKKGTKVELTVLRGANAKEITVSVTREKIEAQTVEYEMLENSVGYIKVTEFDDVTTNQYQEALTALENQGMERLVVDLRNNPGGNLNTVCEMLDLMLPEGLIVYTEDKDGRRQEASSDEEHQFTKPMAVLVNDYSASASEIYAGAIQDYGLGKIIGTQTYGKGVVQKIFDLKDGTCVKLTVAEYFTPKGRNINGKGITPDIEVKYEYHVENPEVDNQLNKALEVLKEEQ